MAKKRKKVSTKRKPKKINPARFSLKALHAAFNLVERQIRNLRQPEA